MAPPSSNAPETRTANPPERRRGDTTAASLARIETLVDRLIKDRETDKAESKEGFKDLKSDIKDAAQKLEKFKDKEFKEISDKVDKLRLHWAKMLGMAGAAAAGISIVLQFVIEAVKSRLH